MFRERLSRAVSGVFFFEGPSRVRAAGPAVGERMCVRRMRWPRPRVYRTWFRQFRRRSPERQIGFAEPWRYECCGCFVPKKFPFGGGVSPDTGASSAVSGPRGGVLSCPACGRANRPTERKRFMLDLRPGRRMKMRRERPAAGGGDGEAAGRRFFLPHCCRTA